VKFRGSILVVSLPEENISFNPFSLAAKNVHLIGSVIASPKQMREMLAFAAKHNIGCLVENFPINKVNEALEVVRSGKIRYRAVLEI